MNWERFERIVNYVVIPLLVIAAFVFLCIYILPPFTEAARKATVWLDAQPELKTAEESDNSNESTSSAAPTVGKVDQATIDKIVAEKERDHQRKLELAREEHQFELERRAQEDEVEIFRLAVRALNGDEAAFDELIQQAEDEEPLSTEGGTPATGDTENTVEPLTVPEPTE